MRILFCVILTASAFWFASVTCYAQDHESVILTIDGAVAGNATFRLSLDQIEAIGSTTITTTTPWHDGLVTFSGVLIRDLLKHVGAVGDMIAVVALNNYRTKIPISDLEKFDPILATKKNGDHMPIHDKGPLFIVYPYDSDDVLKSEVYYSRSAWQVQRITVE